MRLSFFGWPDHYVDLVHEAARAWLDANQFPNCRRAQVEDIRDQAKAESSARRRADEEQRYREFKDWRNV